MYILQLIKMRMKPNVAKNAPSHKLKLISSNIASVIVDLLLQLELFIFVFILCVYFFLFFSSLLFVSSLTRIHKVSQREKKCALIRFLSLRIVTCKLNLHVNVQTTLLYAVEGASKNKNRFTERRSTRVGVN